MIKNKSAHDKAELYFIQIGHMPKKEDRTEPWILHHKNPDLKINDPVRYNEWRIEDLIPMTNGEHTSLHNSLDCQSNRDRLKKMSRSLKGHGFTEEARKKISDSMKEYIKLNGCNKHFGPHTETEETKQRKHEARAGKVMCNNGIKNKFFDPDSIPEG